MENLLEGIGLLAWAKSNWYSIIVTLLGALFGTNILGARKAIVKVLNLVRTIFTAKADNVYSNDEYAAIGKEFVEIVVPAVEEAWDRIRGLWVNRSK